MAWTTPKTNWTVTYDNQGKFVGDFINIGDYKRIKDNISYVQSLAELIAFDTYPAMGVDKTYLDYPRASEWNLIEQALSQLASNIGGSFTAAFFMDNGLTPDYVELNRIESETLKLKGQYEVAIALNYRMATTLGRERSVIKP